MRTTHPLFHELMSDPHSKPLPHSPAPEQTVFFCPRAKGANAVLVTAIDGNDHTSKELDFTDAHAALSFCEDRRLKFIYLPELEQKANPASLPES